MYDVVIKNGTVVNSWGMIEADVAVSSETIVAVGLGLSGKREIDAGGKLVIPGAVDTHVHLSLDLGGGLISSDDFFTGTRAAAFGGTTTVVPFVHPESGETMESAFRRRQNEAEGDVVVDYGWHMNIGPDAFKELGGLQAAVNRVKSLGIVTFKLYMAYGYRLSDSQLFQAMEAVGRAGGLSVVHAENWDLISFLVERAVHAGEHHPRWHETCRPSSFEAEAVSKVAAIAAYLSFPAEIFHVGNRAVSKTIEDARKKISPYSERPARNIFFSPPMPLTVRASKGHIPFVLLRYARRPTAPPCGTLYLQARCRLYRPITVPSWLKRKRRDWKPAFRRSPEGFHPSKCGCLLSIVRGFVAGTYHLNNGSMCAVPLRPGSTALTEKAILLRGKMPIS